MQAAPSFTAVAARQQLQRSDPNQTQKVVWTSDVRQYVQRAFEDGNAIPGIDMTAMQEKLRAVITQATESGQLESINWATYPLPQEIIKTQRDQAVLYGTRSAVFANISAPSPDPSSQLSARKRKNYDMDATEAEDRATTPPWKKKQQNKSKKQIKKEERAEALRMNELSVNTDMLEKRRQRFGIVSPEPYPVLSPRDATPEPSLGPLVGTRQTLEKNYFRLTAPPAVDTVRPLPVLERALTHVLAKWENERNYHYACDQLKSMRQDLTVQHIKNEHTVKVYEAHARIALEKKDLGEYNQCQTQLRALYKSGLSGNVEEFTAYRILYIIYTCNRTDMNNMLADLTSTDKRLPGVQHALQVRSALASGNYHKFFKLCVDPPFISGHLLDLIIERERIAATAAICRACVFLRSQYAVN